MTPTVATPHSASGTRMLHELSPKMRTDSPINHKEPGVLSTVMKFDESKEPKNQAFQLVPAACAAAE